MPRRKKIFKKLDRNDAKFQNPLVGKFIMILMKDGKKSIAEKIIYDSFDLIHAETKKGGLNVFEQAIKNVSPLLEVKSRRIGGANYQVPVPVVGERRTTLAMRWIKGATLSKKGKKMAAKLATELIDASNKMGASMKKREDVHKMAEANKAFAHFA